MELFDLYDDERKFTGETIERGKPLPENRYHLVIHICIFNSDGKMLIQQRQPFKKSFPGKWDVSVGGSAVAGENSRQAASRELYEELGISHDFLHDRPMLTVHFERGFDDVYVIHKDIAVSELKLQPEEVQAAKWRTEMKYIRLSTAAHLYRTTKAILICCSTTEQKEVTFQRSKI